MGNDRVASAMARLDRALARVEAATARRPHASLFDDGDSSGDSRHRTLRGKVEGAISRIDSLLQSEERR